MFSKRGWVFLFLFLPILALAQRPTVNGKFAADSLKIGEQIAFSLSARYSKDRTVLFPDTTFIFSPFEILSKKYFPTRTEQDISFDSAVYYLATFEIDSLQYLRLPVFLVNDQDCTLYYTEIDSIVLKQLVKQVPDSIPAQSLPLKVNAAYQKVRWIFNYPILLIALGSIAVLLILGWIIFGKRIRKYFRLKILHRNYQTFVTRFGIVVDALRAQMNKKQTEEAVSLWKKYMEELTNRPFTKLTSRELKAAERDEKLNQALKDLDRSIYSGHEEFAPTSFEELESYANKLYELKAEEVRNG